MPVVVERHEITASRSPGYIWHYPNIKRDVKFLSAMPNPESVVLLACRKLVFHLFQHLARSRNKFGMTEKECLGYFWAGNFTSHVKNIKSYPQRGVLAGRGGMVALVKCKFKGRIVN